MECAGSDEQDVVGSNETVTRIHRRSFNDRQNVALHAFAAHVWSVTAFATRDLVDFIEEDNSAVLDALDGETRNRIHVDKFLLFFLNQVVDRFSNLHFPLLRALSEKTGKDIFDVDIH